MYLGKITLQMKFYTVISQSCLLKFNKGECIRHSDEVANKLVLWEPTEGKRKRGRRRLTFVDNLLEDTEMENVQEMKTIMLDRMRALQSLVPTVLKTL